VNIDLNALLLVFLALMYAAFLLVARLLTNRFSSMEAVFRRNNRRLATILSLVRNNFQGSFETVWEVKELWQNMTLREMNTALRTAEVLSFEKTEIKALKSFSRVRRKEAGTYLGIIGSEKARAALEEALVREKDPSVKIYLSNALTDIRHIDSLPVMISALIDAHKWYREKAVSNILEYGSLLQLFLMENRNTLEFEWIELIIKYASMNFNEETRRYLFDFVDRYDVRVAEVRKYLLETRKSRKEGYRIEYLEKDMETLLEQACRTLSNYFYTEFGVERFRESDHPIIKANAFWALSKRNSAENFLLLLSRLDDSRFAKTLISTLTKMIETNPRFLYLLEEAFENQEDKVIRSRMARILSNRVEFYIMQLLTKKGQRAEGIIKQVIENKEINELIGFINLNRDLDIENKMVEILRANVDPESEIGIELRTYLKNRVLEKWGVEKMKAVTQARVQKKDPNLINAIWVITLIGFLTVPIQFVWRYWNVLDLWRPASLLKQFVIEFNYGLAFYSIVVSLVYLLLMFFSYFNVRKQARLWNIKTIPMLFRKKMIPSISIVAPSYNEERTIVSSVRSLLNQKYPDYELIVVNDGSRDQTLEKLIEAFELIRVDYAYTELIITKPVRGIYRNSSLPKLVVVDKSNGGKADALNAGINVANKEYFCGIDSDSLLEPDALLKLASLTLDESCETPALGGNIFPINGCKVEHGLITKIAIPGNIVAGFQNMEYLRSFMIGRMGWQALDSLMIISGAFGLFRKDRITNIGGYLTESGSYRKDTVGEDMELVVRISRLMHEKKNKHKILYSYHANCWTEVPEDLKSLKTQRYRWQRGLVDILFFHRKMLFNPLYQKAGLLALPYFLLFEAIGPMFEFQGYLMVLFAALLGILNVKLALLLFIASIFLGMINSIFALLIAEREQRYYSFKDLMTLLLYAVVENFGPRQLASFWRIMGQWTIIFGTTGWGKIQRKGIG
jgi:cellulose synthase/poly-beta-1,6-N-acetylglucosamine synthase-like glycosyltransferase